MQCKFITTLISLTHESAIKLIEKMLKEEGMQDLLPAHASVLGVLYTNNGKLRMSDIAKILSRDKSTITTLIAKMEKNGYLKKTHCKEDKRVYYISLTNKAYKIQNKFQKMSEYIINISYKGFSEEDKDLIIQLTEKVRNNFDKELTKGDSKE